MKIGLLLFIHKDQILLTAWCPGLTRCALLDQYFSFNSWLALVKTMDHLVYSAATILAMNVI